MHDLRLGVRNLLRRPAFTVIALLTLALGIGANVAVFTVSNAVLLSPLPYHDPEQIVMLTERTREFPTLSATRHNFEAWRDRATAAFVDVGAFRPTIMTLDGTGEPERVAVKMITSSLLPLLGVEPAEGRSFGERDDRPGADPVALVSRGFANRAFPDASPIGQAIRLDEQPYAIVGILPARFELFQPADVYLPFGPWAAMLPDDRGWHPGIFPMARLRDGVSLDRARLEMDAVAAQLQAEFPDANRHTGAAVTPALDLMVQNVRPALNLLTASVGLVLLIACANVANLLLARAVDRQKEISVRVALGAGRLRIVRQLVTESLVLALAGGIAGVILASWGVSFLTQLAGPALPRVQQIDVDWRVLLFGLGLSVITGLVFGAVPAIQASRTDIREALNLEGRGGTGSVRHRRLSSALVVVEVGLALVLLVTAGLLLRSFSSLTSVSPGFDPSRLFVVNLPLSPLRHGDPVVRAAMIDRVLERIRAVPGVTSAAVTTTLPMAGSGTTINFNREAYPPKGPDDYAMAGYRAVTPGYLATLGVTLQGGRLLDERDRSDAIPVVVLNETMARQFFPDRDPLGERIQLGTEPDPGFPMLEVVGIVSDVRQAFGADPVAEMFVPYDQFPDALLTPTYLDTALVVRTAGEPLAVAPAVRGAVREIDPQQPLVNPRTMTSAMASTVAQQRFQMTLLTLFGSIAVALAAVGVYGVMAYTVSQRTAEISVRIAVGATPERVVAMVVWQGAQLAAMGVGLGLIAAALAAGAIQSLLYEVRGLDPLTFAVAPAVLAAAALLASYVPARRAARVSPLRALNR